MHDKAACYLFVPAALHDTVSHWHSARSLSLGAALILGLFARLWVTFYLNATWKLCTPACFAGWSVVCVVPRWWLGLKAADYTQSMYWAQPTCCGKSFASSARWSYTFATIYIVGLKLSTLCTVMTDKLEENTVYVTKQSPVWGYQVCSLFFFLIWWSHVGEMCNPSVSGLVCRYAGIFRNVSFFFLCSGSLIIQSHTNRFLGQ